MSITKIQSQENDKSVKRCYSTWSDSYYDDYYGDKAAYPPVHRDILRKEIINSGASNVLDAGCGPASFLRDIVDLELDLYGFDLTPEMVIEAKNVMSGMGYPKDHFWEGSVSDPEAFRLIGPADPQGYDAVVCAGVIPHVPEFADEAVLNNLVGATKPGGLVIVEARNQLFGLFTMNRYSHELFLNELIMAEQMKDRAGEAAGLLEGALDELAGMFRTDLPPTRKGKEDEPGYDEVLSRTHNPFVLKEKMISAGAAEVEVLFYHYHCLPPMFESRLPEFFRKESLSREDARDWRGHFMASAFFVVGKRA